MQQDNRHRWWPMAIGFCAVMVAVPAAQAVVIYDPVEPYRNTSDPGDGSGWHLQALIGGFLGTPIGPHHLITAKHTNFNPNPGMAIHFDSGPNSGRTYTSVEHFDDPGTDLRIVEIAETFSVWAPLYLQQDEAGRTVTVFGRGRAPGSEVMGPSFDGTSHLKGWTYGTDDQVMSWGRNIVSDIHRDSEEGDWIAFDFDADGIDQEAHLSGRDSGGGLFVRNDSGQWMLAGINRTVTFPFQRDADGHPDGEPFAATLFDMGGCWVGSPPEFFADQIQDIPSTAFATRLSTDLAWIGSIVPAAVPLPSTLSLLLAGGWVLLRRQQR